MVSELIKIIIIKWLVLKITLFLCERAWACFFPIFTLLTLFFSFLSRRSVLSLRLWNPLSFDLTSILVAITCVRSNQVEMKSCCGFCVFKSIYLCMWRRDIFSALFWRVSAIMFLFLPFWYDDLFDLDGEGISMLLF